ncbi:MAG: chemotaxis protein CheD [Thermobacillus sp. ZCTH02-B1]|uniref:chemotaxis protein CheD n=1 Tax=Thermobacillus sp. ZCTH02-B1 TaxID=1858795 RepID=UPI000B57165E|nr:chemotaxis protein CheD [Thermobacillus sp. ZCTH02-B1]OUM96958.1 MAG: chemotaxis protein CheD [Thermobacillus sp. ZCTH02-B1]
MTETIKVGMADWKIARSGAVLKTTGLGSCVGLTLYDEAEHIAGMAHIMLPSSEIARETSFNRAKYADTALPDMLEAMIAAGASRRRLVAKLAGGAQMFAFGQDTMRIGPRNVETCKQMLEKLGIPLVAEDTGANYGRTIELDSATGILTIRSIQYGTKEL